MNKEINLVYGKLGHAPWNKGVTGKQKWSDEQRKKFGEYTQTDKFKSRYSDTRNEKIRQSKLGRKRKYLPDGSYIMVKVEVKDGCK